VLVIGCGFHYHNRIDAYTLIRFSFYSDLSKFVEEAVRWRVLDKTVAEVRERNANVPDKEIEAAIDEALASVRAERLKAVAAKQPRKK
jgi:Ribbon-helix-helix domain